MSVRSGQAIADVFTTRNVSTGASNADSLPTGTLYVQGVANGATVTITNVATGVYKFAVTLPTLAVGDLVSVRISATVNSIADNWIVWRDTKDVVVDANGAAAADVREFLGTVITEGGAGRLAGSFSTQHDVAAPVFTNANVNQTGDSFARIGSTGSGLTSLASAANLVIVNNNVLAVTTTVLTESYAADGAAFTVAQALYQITSFLFEATAAGTVVTTKKLNAATTAMTFNINDSANPTSITRAS